MTHLTSIVIFWIFCFCKDYIRPYLENTIYVTYKTQNARQILITSLVDFAIQQMQFLVKITPGL